MITKSHLYILIAAVGFSFIFVYSTALKNSGVSSLEQVFFRLALVLPLIFLINRKKIESVKIDLLLFLSTGLTFALLLFCALSSISLGIPIAVAGGLLYTQPIFTSVISHFSGKEKIKLKKAGLILAGVAGAFLVSGLDIKDLFIIKIEPGILLAVGSGLFYALYLFLKREGIAKGFNPSVLLFYTFLFGLLFLLPLGFILKNFTQETLIIGFTMPNVYQWSLLIGFALFSTMLSYTALNYVNPEEIKPTTEGVILLSELPLKIIWATIIFGQFIAPIQYLGVFFIILAALGINLTKN